MTHTGPYTQTNDFRAVADLGYSRLVPIIPPGVPLCSGPAHSLARGRDVRGKAPGVLRDNGKWSGVDWLRLEATETALHAWAAMGAGVGLRMGAGLGAVDFDTTEVALCEKVVTLFVEHFPHNHQFRIGRSPKCLALLRVVGDSPYRCVQFKNGQRVEFLGEGRQCVVFGTHPVTGKPYYWVAEMPTYDSLPEVTDAHLAAFFAALAALPEAISPVQEQRSAERAENTRDQANLRAPIETVRAAVAAIPNTTAEFPTRDEYIKIGIAIKAAGWDDPQAALEIYDDWCARWQDPPTGAGDPTPAEDWERMHPPFNVGAGWLLAKAAKFGFERNPRDFLDPIEQSICATEEWPDPIDIFGDGSHGPPAELPRGVLPRVLDDYAADMSARIGAPLAFTGAAVLAVASAAIGAKLQIQPRQLDTGWLQPAFLWIGLVEDPGGKKSPVISAAVAPLRAINARCAAEGARRLAEWKMQSKRKNEALAAPRPPITRYTLDNFTMEAASQVLADNPQGVLIVADELSGQITALDAYKSSKGGDRSSMLRLFDGGALQIDRVGTGQTHVPVWGASILGGIQPKRIAAMADNLEEDGLLQRFLPIIGDGRHSEGLDRSVDARAKHAYDEAIATIAQHRYPRAAVVRMSPAAGEVLSDIHQRVRKLADLPDVSDAWRGHLGKWPGIAARLMLIGHVFDCAPLFEASCEAINVSAQTAEKVSRLCDFLIAHSLRFYSRCVGLGVNGDEARWIAGYLLARLDGEEKVTRRDLGQARHPLRDPRRASEAMKILEYAGWVRPDASNLDTRGASQAWWVSPKIHAQFQTRAVRERELRDERKLRIAEAAEERRRLAQVGASDE